MPIYNRNTLLYLLAFVNFTNIVDSMLIMPLGDTFITEFDLSAVEYTWLVSSYALAAAVSSFLGFIYMDRFDRRQVLLFIYAGFGLGTLLCAFAHSYYTLLALRFFTGLFGGMIGAVVLSIASDLFPFKERGRAMGILFASFSAASAFGIPIGIYLAEVGEWQMPFIIIGGVALLMCAVVWKVFPTMNEHLKEASSKGLADSVRQVLEDSNQSMALIAGFVLIMAHFMIIPFISPFLIKNVGLTQMDIAYQFLLGGLATLITSPIIGRMTDRFGVMKVFIVVMVLSFVPTLLITHLSFVPLGVALTYTTVFFMLGSGRLIAPNTMITAAAPVANRGSFMSIKSALQQFAIALTSLIGGAIVYIGPDGTFVHYNWLGYMAIVLCLISIWLVSKLVVAEGN